MRLTPKKMRNAIERYYDGCNSADRKKIASCLRSDAVHYLPGREPVKGAESIADLWVELVRTQGSQWTIDHFLARGREAVIEWSHHRTRIGHVLRGTEWFEFDTAARIKEIRAYYAAPRDPNTPVLELGGFPYKERGYLKEVRPVARDNQPISS